MVINYDKHSKATVDHPSSRHIATSASAFRPHTLHDLGFLPTLGKPHWCWRRFLPSLNRSPSFITFFICWASPLWPFLCHLSVLTIIHVAFLSPRLPSLPHFPSSSSPCPAHEHERSLNLTGWSAVLCLSPSRFVWPFTEPGLCMNTRHFFFQCSCRGDS